MLGPIEHHGFRSIPWMHLNAAFWHNHQGICIEQGSQNMRTLVACCMGNETSITPLYIGTYIVAAHNAVTDTVLDNNINLWFEEARMAHHFAYHGTAK